MNMYAKLLLRMFQVQQQRNMYTILFDQYCTNIGTINIFDFTKLLPSNVTRALNVKNFCALIRQMRAPNDTQV